jgi:hypothetical protein
VDELPSDATEVAGAAWRIFAATAIGAAHTASGLPHQDALGARPAPGPDPVTLPFVVAVADGHGHPRHFRSARGARLAVDVACEIGLELEDAIAAANDPGTVVATLREKLIPMVVARWKDRVIDDLAALPVTAPELAASAAGPDQGDLIAYGSTLLVAVVAGQWVGCAQIGDGDVVAIGPAGETWQPIPGDATLDGYHTTSLCQEDAEDAFRWGLIAWAERPLAALALCTDGYGNAQATDPWQPTFGADLARLVRDRGPRWIADELPQWVSLCASAEGSGDDTTMALILGPDPVNRIPSGVVVDPTVDAGSGPGVS